MGTGLAVVGLAVIPHLAYRFIPIGRPAEAGLTRRLPLLSVSSFPITAATLRLTPPTCLASLTVNVSSPRTARSASGSAIPTPPGGIAPLCPRARAVASTATRSAPPSAHEQSFPSLGALRQPATMRRASRFRFSMRRGRSASRPRRPSWTRAMTPNRSMTDARLAAFAQSSRSSRLRASSAATIFRRPASTAFGSSRVPTSSTSARSGAARLASALRSPSGSRQAACIPSSRARDEAVGRPLPWTRRSRARLRSAQERARLEAASRPWSCTRRTSR
jgi:hypothetical protein